jgi:hypothetical protein
MHTGRVRREVKGKMQASAGHGAGLRAQAPPSHWLQAVACWEQLACSQMLEPRRALEGVKVKATYRTGELGWSEVCVGGDPRSGARCCQKAEEEQDSGVEWRRGAFVLCRERALVRLWLARVHPAITAKPCLSLRPSPAQTAPR